MSSESGESPESTCAVCVARSHVVYVRVTVCSVFCALKEILYGTYVVDDLVYAVRRRTARRKEVNRMERLVERRRMVNIA